MKHLKGSQSYLQSSARRGQKLRHLPHARCRRSARFGNRHVPSRARHKRILRHTSPSKPSATGTYLRLWYTVATLFTQAQPCDYHVSCIWRFQPLYPRHGLPRFIAAMKEKNGSKSSWQLELCHELVWDLSGEPWPMGSCRIGDNARGSKSNRQVPMISSPQSIRFAVRGRSALAGQSMVRKWQEL